MKPGSVERLMIWRLPRALAAPWTTARHPIRLDSARRRNQSVRTRPRPTTPASRLVVGTIFPGPVTGKGSAT